MEGTMTFAVTTQETLNTSEGDLNMCATCYIEASSEQEARRKVGNVITRIRRARG